MASLEEINQQALEWCLQVAGVRVHGTTSRQPLTTFHIGEEEQLKLLLAVPFGIVTWCQAGVARDCNMQLNGTLHCMPFHYAGQTVDVKLRTRVGRGLPGLRTGEDLTGVRGRRVADCNDYPPQEASFFKQISTGNGGLLLFDPDICGEHQQSLCFLAVSASH